MEIIPRRNRLDLMTPAEIAIHLAILEVEKVGADVKLTKAVVLLYKAKGLVADFIETPEFENNDIHYWKCPECGDFIATNKKTPSWLIEQIKIYHLHKEMQTPCRGVYVEITKDKFWELSDNQK